MKNNRNITIILGVVVVAIWGTVGYRVYNGYNNAETESNLNTNTLQKSGFNRYEYKKDIRDPFDIMPNVPRTESVTPILTGIKKVENWLPPPFKLNGVIIDKERKIVIIEGNNGSTSFLSEGDSIDGVTIVRVESSNVIYKYQGREQKWRID